MMMMNHLRRILAVPAQIGLTISPHIAVCRFFDCISAHFSYITNPLYKMCFWDKWRWFLIPWQHPSQNSITWAMHGDSIYWSSWTWSWLVVVLVLNGLIFLVWVLIFMVLVLFVCDGTHHWWSSSSCAFLVFYGSGRLGADFNYLCVDFVGVVPAGSWLYWLMVVFLVVFHYWC